jgi:hypothetical protein
MSNVNNVVELDNEVQKAIAKRNKVLQNAQDLIASYYKINKASQVIFQIITSTLSCFLIHVEKIH